MANADYTYEDVTTPTQDAEAVARLLAPPAPPAPPVEDHPMVQFAKQLLSPLQYAGSGSTFRSPEIAAAPQPVQPDYSPGLNAVSDFGANIDRTPVLGGIKSLVTTPFSQIGQNLWGEVPYGTPLEQYPRGQYEPDPSAVAQDAYGMTIGGYESALAQPAIDAAVGQVALRSGAALGRAGEAIADVATNPAVQRFATEDSGLGRVDLGLTGAAKDAAATARETAPYTPGFMQTAEQRIAGAGVTQKQVASELGVNIAKIDAPQDVKDYIIQTAKENAGFADQRRGVVTIAEQQAAAAKQSIDIQAYSYLKPGTAMNAEDLTAVGNAMVRKGNEVASLQEIIRQEAALGRVSKENQLRLLLAAGEHQTLQRVYSGARSEAGRSLRALQEVADGLSAGEINNAYDRASAILGGKDKVGALTDTLQKIWTDPNLDAATRERATYQFVQNLDSPKLFDRLNAFWINSVLSGPVTHAVNVTGQVALQLAEMTSKTLSAGIEATITAGGTLRPRERFFSEALAGPFGSIMGLPRGFRQAAAMLRTGTTPEMVNKFIETGRLGAREVNAGALNIPTRFLGAEDQVFYATGYSRGLYEKAANIAASEKRGILSGEFGKRMGELLGKPTDAMLTYADEMGKRAGLRADPGKINSAVLKVRDVNILPEAISKYTGEFQPLRYVIPFVNTPTQLVKIGAEYSPLGLAKLVTAKGGARSDILARSLLGSTGMAMLASQYAQGNITGAAPSDPASRDAFYAEGKIPYAIRLGNEWVSFGRLEPIATPLKWTAVLLDTAKQDPGKPWDVTAAKMAAAIGKSFKDSTYLSGFSALADAIDDPNAASKFVSRLVGGFVPRLLTTAVQANDPLLREPEGIVQQIESTLPLLNETVPPKQTVYGEDATRSDGKQGIAGVISPVDFNNQTVDPITQRLQQYHLPESFGPDGRALPARAMLVGPVGEDIASFQLSPEEGRDYQKYAGQASYNMLGQLFNDKLPYDGKAFSRLTPEDQVRAIRKTVADARVVGRAQTADEIMHSATTDAERSRAADMRMSTIGKRQDRAQYVEGLRATGDLTPAVSRFLDSRRDKGEPSTAEYLKAAPLVREYLAMPPYRIGNPDEWEKLKVVRAAAAKYAQNTPHSPSISETDLYARVDPQGAALLHRYGSDLARNPNRERLLRANPWLSDYLG